MPDTPRTIAELLTIYADGQAPGSITEQDLRDFVVSVEAFDAALQADVDAAQAAADAALASTGAVPAGGTAGQALTKVDADDYDVEWSGPYLSTATTRTANTVLAGPTSGAAAAPAFRALVAADLPVDAWTALTDGATITQDATGKREAKGYVTLGGNRTIAITGAVNGSAGIIRATQDGTGSRTLTLPTGSKIVGGGGTAPTLSTAAGAVDFLAWEYDGTTYWWTVGLAAA